MFYEAELVFLCDVYRKHRLHAEKVLLSELSAYLNRRDTDAVFGGPAGGWAAVPESEVLSPCTVYRFRDAFERCCLFLLLPETDIPAVLFVGPYLTDAIPQQRLLEMGAAHGIPPQKQRYLTEYYATIPVVGDENPLWGMFSTFCERIWKSPSFSIRDLAEPHSAAGYSRFDITHGHSTADTLVDMKALEQRYAFENQIIRAVSLGQLHLEGRLRMAFRTANLEKRAKDPLRNAKNYGIIMNTLFRKAAESGGVHPLHLDRVSGDFAVKIEQLASLSDASALMTEMFRVYCRLVRRHSIQKYSLVVQRTLLMVEEDLSADLSPHILAESQGITLGYLSTVFKKETGETVTEYIRKKRMEYARFLLSTTNLQVQTVALHCGVMDVQYFSKMFKKAIGKTPTEYRAALMR